METFGMRSVLFCVAALVTCSVPAAAADMPARPAPVVAAAPLYNWGGFYGGINAGWAWGPTNWQYNVVPPVSMSQQMGGGLGGFQAGYNFQIASFVLGIEGDYEFANINATGLCPNPAFICHSKTRNIADIAGRVGYAWDRVLFYAKGGEAWAFNRYESLASFNTIGGAETRSGWLGGVGIEYAYDPCWSVKAEYNYLDFGTTAVARYNANGSPATGIDVAQKMNIAKVGINYKFGGPLVAKY
jgi:outer membrane immunogenic protein